MFGSIRKPADAERLQSECGGQFTPLFFEVAEEAAVHLSALTKLRGMLAQMSSNRLPPDRIAALLHQALTDAQPKARMVALPQPIQSWIADCLPRRWRDRIIAKQNGLGFIPRD